MVCDIGGKSQRPRVIEITNWTWTKPHFSGSTMAFREITIPKKEAPLTRLEVEIKSSHPSTLLHNLPNNPPSTPNTHSTVLIGL